MKVCIVLRHLPVLESSLLRSCHLEGQISEIRESRRIRIYFLEERGMGDLRVDSFFMIQSRMHKFIHSF
jgi:hypothetical protein